MDNPNNGVTISQDVLLAFLAGQTARQERSCQSLDQLVVTLATLAVKAIALEEARQAAPPKESQAELVRAQAELVNAEALKVEAQARLLEAQNRAKAEAEMAENEDEIDERINSNGAGHGGESPSRW